MFQAEVISYGFPSVIVILSFGYFNFATEKTLRKTISKILTTPIQEHLKEDISIFLLCKDFQLNAYKFYNVGFASVSQVSCFTLFKFTIKIFVEDNCACFQFADDNFKL